MIFALIFLSFVAVAALAVAVWLSWRYLRTLEFERNAYRQGFYLQSGLDGKWVKQITEGSPTMPKPKAAKVEAKPDAAPPVNLAIEAQRTWTEQDWYAFGLFRDDRRIFPLAVDDATAFAKWYEMHGDKTPLQAFQVT